MDNQIFIRLAYNKYYEPFLFFLVFIIHLFFIIYNGNMLMDGTDKRKYLRKKYNDFQIY